MKEQYKNGKQLFLVKRKQSSFFLGCDLRKLDFDQIHRNDRSLNPICKACFVSYISFWGLLKTRNVERGLKSACSQQLVKFEKERMKEKCDFSHLSNWMKLPRDWIGWMVEIVAIKQTTISTTTELDFLLLLSTSERNAVFSSYSNNPTFLEWQFRDQEHLKMKMEMKWKSTCCLQVGSV